jgi:nucleoside 2-deoxyribosyltransferase
MSQRVYLAGPEMFLAMAREIGARKRAICVRYGLVGIYPVDEPHTPDPGRPRLSKASPSARRWSAS